ncbi:hypothetical protein KOY48_02990 [Candidatus Minimicrobia naudis]|uniref:Lactate/malate dehydrogenase N-terminal domain-containing protein n=1 Tax=Candidatus Minimicrobia naudis TaxID=2841263 RepID=A0A8F1SAV3_9BACT|nr:hypothetical protein KOY48_02990 [Candidatus Minimicrobia naudis]
MNKQKLLIVGGGGMVGATAAYACALLSVIEEIVLIDRNADLAWGQAADINDAMGLDRNGGGSSRAIILISMTMTSLLLLWVRRSFLVRLDWSCLVLMSPLCVIL